jgi:hypothetical protein
MSLLGSILLTGTFIDLQPADISSMLGYVEQLLLDLKPLLMPVIAIGLGIFIFWAVVSALK